MPFQSILPPEAFEHGVEQPALEVRSCKHGAVEGHRDERGGFVVARLISTDPMAYLDDGFAPGSVLPPEGSAQ